MRVGRIQRWKCESNRCRHNSRVDLPCILQGRLMIKMNRPDYRLTKLQEVGNVKVADPALLFKATVTIPVINMSWIWFAPGW